MRHRRADTGLAAAAGARREDHVLRRGDRLHHSAVPVLDLAARRHVVRHAAIQRVVDVAAGHVQISIRESAGRRVGAAARLRQLLRRVLRDDVLRIERYDLHRRFVDAEPPTAASGVDRGDLHPAAVELHTAVPVLASPAGRLMANRAGVRRRLHVDMEHERRDRGSVRGRGVGGGTVDARDL